MVAGTNSHEFAFDQFPQFIRHMGVGNAGQRFRPSECGAFAGREERCIPPDRQRSQTPLVLAGAACIGRVAVDTVGASIDL